MPKKAEPTYQKLSIELDEVLASLQNPEVTIDEAARLYERGLQLVGKLEQHLQQAENTITKFKLAAQGDTQLPAGQ